MGATILQRVADKSARIAIIGQGYVGLPLGLVFAEAGFRVSGFDVDPAKVAAINRGESYIKQIGKERVAQAVKSGRYVASADFDGLKDADAIIICVPTPLGLHREPDNGYIHATAREIAKRLRKGQLVILESTTYPGTTDEEVQPILATSGLKCPDDFLLAFSPEREDPGNASFSTKTIPKVVGGINSPSTEAAVALYSAAIDKVVPVSNARVAESAKLLENIYRSVNIALVNELKVAFDKMGIDVWEVIEAAKTKPFGFTPFYPGPGLGGHCIPLDPFYLSWKAAEYGVWTRFIHLAGEVNTNMPHYVVDKTAAALNDQSKSLKGAKICVLGLAYKADIDDDRESPSYEIIELLKDRGAEVAYCDPYFPVARKTRKYDLGMSSTPCTNEALRGFDALVISTAHKQFKDAALYAGVKLVVDSRNTLSPAPSGTAWVKA
ncbi:MAG: nucleotide sugar dehydrogenase [Deltaproteobacteria bacterium]|nr:nucleotide sugar dehydrogenase [Deltaproteobacteria bacterium]